MADIRPKHDLNSSEIDALEERLYEVNAKRTGFHDAQGIGFLAEEGGVLVGAVAGFTWGGVCELQQVWVDETHRGHGLGRSLLEAALAEAARRGCAAVFLATYDFQAPAFYAQFGFEEVARIPDKPLGHTDIIMRLRLRNE